jgi:hypothetical protein
MRETFLSLMPWAARPRAEQTSQVFSFSGLLKLVRDVRFAPIAAKMLQCRE